jgi:hypothetical protein
MSLLLFPAVLWMVGPVAAALPLASQAGTLAMTVIGNGTLPGVPVD